jgi:hypothetical protein
MLLFRLLPAAIAIALITLALKIMNRYRPLYLRSDGMIFCWPPYWENHTGLTQREAIMKPFYKFITPDSDHPVTILKEASVRSGYVFRFTGKDRQGKPSRSVYILQRRRTEGGQHSGYILHHVWGAKRVQIPVAAS